MRRYLIAGLIVAVLAVPALWLGIQIGGDDADNDGDSVGGRNTPVSGASHDAMPGPPWGVPAPTPTPTPGPTDAPEPEAGVVAAVAADEPERGEPAPQPEPAGGALIDGVALTFYTCIGDSTGRYCGTMASGQPVHRGAAACGYAWELGQRFRILGDPFPDMVYTCLDRGGGPYLWIDIWFHDAAEGRAWRNALPQYVTVELLP